MQICNRPHPSHPSNNLCFRYLSRKWPILSGFRWSNISSMASSDVPTNVKGREVELLVRWRVQSFPVNFSFFLLLSPYLSNQVFFIKVLPGAQRILGNCWQWLDRAECWVLGRRTRFSLKVSTFLQKILRCSKWYKTAQETTSGASTLVGSVLKSWMKRQGITQKNAWKSTRRYTS